MRAKRRRGSAEWGASHEAISVSEAPRWKRRARIVCSCPSLRAASAATDAVPEEAAEGPGGASSAGAPAGERAPLLQVAAEEEEVQGI